MHYLYICLIKGKKEVILLMDTESENRILTDLLFILKNEVKPSLGCTEPVALGIAVSEAYRVVKGILGKVNIRLSPNIYKNGMGVGIPGTTEKGLFFAAALGITCGDSKAGLEVFKNVNNEFIKLANELLAKNIFSIMIEEELENFYIEAEVHTNQGTGICVIKDRHTNIILVKSNEKIILQKEDSKEIKENNSYGRLKEYKVADIRKFVESVDFTDIEFLLDGVKMNMDIAEMGLKEKSGPGLGAALNLLMKEGVMQDDIINKARVLTASACDARMAGVNMPVMSSAGSGNHGLTAIIPTNIIAVHMGFGKEKLARMLAFSHLVTSYIKVYTGRLSAICGCAIAAGIGASVSITWALGGTDQQIYGAIKNMIASLSGMVCDGAKGGCAFKLSTAVSEAMIQAQFALKDVFVSDIDGIIGNDVETTIKNLGEFCTEGMKCADASIINIMANNKSNNANIKS